MTINFNVNPYYDDYTEDDKFLRVLFRPGYAVQARELTQAQTILQKQVSRLGDHIFKNGSMVIPGNINVDNKVHFAKLEDLNQGVSVKSYLTQFRDKVITGQTSGLKAVVIDTSECACVLADEKEIATLYYKIEGTGDDDETKRFIPGEQLVAEEADNQIATNYRLTVNQTGSLVVNVRSFGDTGLVGTSYTNDPIKDVLGFGYVVEVEAGIYYVDGFFVKNDELHLYIGRFSVDPTNRVGFRVNETIVTPEDDENLNDNAQGSNNFAAPGAHRYKIELELIKKELQTADEDRFIELLRVKAGRVQQKIDKSSYAELEKTFARRTFDESGSYEVNKFKLSTFEHLLDAEKPLGVYTAAQGGSEDKFVIGIDPGKAYVQGYEVESVSTQYLTLNKARSEADGHVARLNNQPIATPVGNYCLVNSVYKYPDIATFQTVYLVRTLNTVGGASPSTADIVGTAKVRSFQLHNGDYTAPIFKLSLFEIVMNEGSSFETDVKSIVNGLSGSTNFTCNIVPTFKQLSGSATSTTGATAVTGVGTKFTDDINAFDVVYIDGTLVGTVASDPSVNTTLTLAANGAAAKTGGVISIFRAKLFEPEFNSLLYKVGYESIKTLLGWDGSSYSARETSTKVRRVFGVKTAGDNKIEHTLNTDLESFASDQDISNFILINTTTNAIVPIDSADVTLSSNNTKVEIQSVSKIANGTNYLMIATVNQANSEGGAKEKILTSNTEYITGQKTVTTKSVALAKADVLRIKSVLMNPGNFTNNTFTTGIDVTDRFVLDDGQRDTHYTNASLVLKPGQSVPSGALRVEYQFFNYGTTGDYFSVDSYTNSITQNTDFNYEDIPSYSVRSKDGKRETVYLHDVIDYRPVIGGSNTSLNEIPVIGNEMLSDIAYYLPRFDKIVLDSVGRFNIIVGVPAVSPQEPLDPKDGMVLASVMVPAYTKSVGDIKFYQRDNRRYTMRDIGDLERRISNLEYYVSLNLLETDTAQLQIKDALTGIDRFKNGFIVDQFTGHGIGDVKNSDYKVSVDTVNRELRPMHFTQAVDIVEDLESAAQRASNGYKKTGDFISLPYAEEIFIFNPNGTRTIDVNPYKIGAFKGEIVLSPESDVWKDTERRPDLTVVDDNGYDAIRFMAEQLGVTGTQWGEWQTNWTGISTSTSTWQTGDPNRRRQTVTGFEQTITTETGIQSREGIQTTLSSTVNAVDYGDRVVDISYAPYMRARPIVYTAKNLKASTKFYGFFDGRSISEFIKPADVFKVNLATGATKMVFDPAELTEQILTDSFFRTENGVVEAAYSVGDVVQNEEHTATNITAITHITNVLGETSFTLSVASATGIRPGHFVQLYNLAAARSITSPNSLFPDLARTTSTIINYSLNTSEELNYRIFKVTNVSGTTVTLADPNGATISAFSAYNTAAYNSGDGGKLKRLTASGVVAFAGAVTTYTNLTESGVVNTYPSDMEIHVVNIKGGFAPGDVLTGQADISTGLKNRVDLELVNGTGVGLLPTMKQRGDSIRTDVWGSAVGTFYLPANTFKSGERAFKLIDNISNNDAAFDSKGSAMYISSGTTLSKERTIVNSRDVRFVQDRLYEEIPVRRTSTSTRVLYSYWTGHDPVAQTFTVSSLGGAFVTGVDMYFSEAGNRPVTVEIRTTNNGVPSSKIVPLTEVTLSPQQLKVSDDGSVATRFNFAAPVYLQDAETYAIVVKTDEPGCQVFVSELGQNDIITNNIVTSQPLTGSLFLSQNTQEFQINPLLDLKFGLYKATFDTSATVVAAFKAVPPHSYELQTNPFEVSTGTTKIRVLAKNHGFNANDKVIISGVAEGNYGSNDPLLGIPASLLNGPQTVIADGLEDDSFVFEITTQDSSIPPQNLLAYKTSTSTQTTTADFVKGNYGGTGVTITRQYQADQLYLKTADLTFQDTTLTYKVSAENAAGTMIPYAPIVANADYIFDTRKTVKSLENQYVNPVTSVIRPSLRLQARISSSNPNVSPMIDMQKISAYVVKNLINDVQEFDLNVEAIDKRKLLDNTVTSSLVCANGTGTCTIVTDDDAADNLLATVTAGKYIKIENCATNINGKFLVKSVVVSTDTVDSGDAEGDKVTLTLEGNFTATGTVTTNTQGSTFAISVLDKYVADFAPVGASNKANYITRTLLLDSPADSIKILFDANLAEGTDLQVYYRAWENTADLNTLNYVDTGFTKSTSDAQNVFSERNITVEDIKPFTNLAIKIVMKSSHPVYVPKLKNLRLVAYS
jgi:hypothetical protein